MKFKYILKIDGYFIKIKIDRIDSWIEYTNINEG